MADFKQLNKEDILFIAGETESIYQHTAGLVILDSSGRPDFDFEHFRESCIERVSLVPHFRWKLHEVPMGLDRPYWVEDEDFNYDNHIKRIALPHPGDHIALSEIAAYLYSRHLSRKRPLWEIWFIEGLEGGKFAIFQKLHHSVMDGQGANKLGEIMCDFEPDPSAKKTVDKSIAEAKPGRVPSPKERSRQARANLARLPLDAAKAAYGMVLPKVLEQFTWRRKPKKDKPAIPMASFNADIGKDRAFVFGSLSLADIKTIKQRFDVSVNDVVLALVSGAVRNYLTTHSELPKESLRACIAVSTRTEDDDGFSNKVTVSPLTLATDEDDPLRRLKCISVEAEEAKTQARGGAMGTVEILQIMPPVLVSTLMSTLSADQAPKMLGANLVVSNIRGSSAPMYISGVRMETMYPMSILTSGMGINITCLSYVDKIDFGIALDPDLVPEPWSLIDGLGLALAEYLALTGKRKKATRGQKTVKRKKAASKKAPAAKKAKATSKKTAPKKDSVRKKTAAKKTAAKKAV